MFLCFEPREHPKIVIAVVVENAGYGSKWAAPIGSMLIEIYLNDTLRAERIKESAIISNTNLMPAYLNRVQFHEDSMRVTIWVKQTGDSSQLLKYL